MLSQETAGIGQHPRKKRHLVLADALNTEGEPCSENNHKISLLRVVNFVRTPSAVI